MHSLHTRYYPEHLHISTHLVQPYEENTPYYTHLTEEEVIHREFK